MNKSSSNTDAIALASRKINPSLSEIELTVPDIHCAGCISTIEKALLEDPAVSYARVNLTTRRVRIRWHSTKRTPALLELIANIGFKAFVPETRSVAADGGDIELKRHIRALAVSGFAAGNVMMLSLSVWSGADDQTRHLFHMISAAIALPALIFSSRIFFVSAWRALQVGRTNMDVPICVGIIVTTLLSIYDTTSGGKQVYFDAAIMLVFLLLIGRTLETRMRAKARSSVDDLANLQPAVARIISTTDQQTVSTPIQQVRRGDLLHISQDERVPVDCKVVSGSSYIDKSLLSGESTPVRVVQGDVLFSGYLNLEGQLRAVATENVDESFLARIERQIEDASAQKGHYQQMAEKVIRYYTPFVHLAALLGFLIWMWHSGDWYRSVSVGVTVLIITCPCALGLAVPIARVIAAHQLIKQGVLMRDGSALERLALVTAVIFDKTGTLTTGQTQLGVATSRFDQSALSIAQALCGSAEHPYAKAIHRHKNLSEHAKQNIKFKDWREVPGDGIVARLDTDIYQLGRAEWAQITSNKDSELEDGGTVLTRNGCWLARFTFEDSLKNDASNCIKRLQQQGLSVEILSGDADDKVRHVADKLNIAMFKASVRPDEKLEHVQSYQSLGKHVLMVGDGINDSPALAVASVSMVPGTGADMTRKMADFVLLNENLKAIPVAVTIAQKARRIVAQNLTLAVGYNVVALPLAMSGTVTPLIAAVAMSFSSVLVIGNSLRLGSVNRTSTLQTTWQQPDMAMQQ